MKELELREWQRVLLPRASFGPDEHAALLRLPGHAFHLRERGGQLELRARAHVGRVQLGRLTVTVRPKLAEGPLLRLFTYAHNLGHLRPADPVAYPGGAHLQDILGEQLRRHIEDILDRGLHRSYRRMDLDLSVPRGRLDTAALARRIPLLRPVLPCVTHERSVDNPLNRLLHAGLVFAAHVVTHEPLRQRIRQLAARLADALTPEPLSPALIAAARRSLHRLVAHYRPALHLIELLYAGAGLDLGARTTTFTAQGFLFDMNRFFQALVRRLLEEGLPECSVEHEEPLRRAYQWATPHLPGRLRPTPRPDFIVSHADRSVILDAKYRDLSRAPLPREILYQLTMYAVSQGPGGAAAILYPRHEASALAQERLDLWDARHEAPHASLYLRPVPLLELAASIDAGAPGLAARQALARGLVFGPQART